jgi:hypothetical protein
VFGASEVCAAPSRSPLRQPDAHHRHARDGIGEPGSEIAKLVGHGFVEISTANAGLGVI